MSGAGRVVGLAPPPEELPAEIFGVRWIITDTERALPSSEWQNSQRFARWAARLPMFDLNEFLLDRYYDCHAPMFTLGPGGRISVEYLPTQRWSP